MAADPEIEASRRVLRHATSLPSDPKVQAAIADARRDAAAAFEQLPPPDTVEWDEYHEWSEFHAESELWAAWGPDFVGCMTQVFGSPADQVWALRHRATGVIAIARPIYGGEFPGWCLAGAGEHLHAVAAALAALIDRVPPADFEMLAELGNGLKRIGSIDGTAYAEAVRADEQLAYYDRQLAAAPDDLGRALIKLRTLVGALNALPDEAAEHQARVLRHVYDVVPIVEAMQEATIAEFCAAMLDGYASFVEVPVPDDVLARIRALRRRYPFPGRSIPED